MAAELNALNVTSSNSNVYWNLLKDLTPEVKIDLIAKLSNSLLKKEEVDATANWTDSFAGKWQDNRSASEIVEDIRRSRHQEERKIEL